VLEAPDDLKVSLNLTRDILLVDESVSHTTDGGVQLNGNIKLECKDCGVKIHLGLEVDISLNPCEDGKVYQAGLCYDPCPASHPEGILHICYATCPSYLINFALECAKPAFSEYGRGTGRVYWRRDKCQEIDAPKLGVSKCEKYGALWYPVCRPKFKSFGCCICNLQCPPGWTDTGSFCRKPSYYRGIGKPISLKPSVRVVFRGEVVPTLALQLTLSGSIEHKTGGPVPFLDQALGVVNRGIMAALGPIGLAIQPKLGLDYKVEFSASGSLEALVGMRMPITLFFGFDNTLPEGQRMLRDDDSKPRYELIGPRLRAQIEASVKFSLLPNLGIGLFGIIELNVAIAPFVKPVVEATGSLELVDARVWEAEGEVCFKLFYGVELIFRIILTLFGLSNKELFARDWPLWTPPPALDVCKQGAAVLGTLAPPTQTPKLVTTPPAPPATLPLASCNQNGNADCESGATFCSGFSSKTCISCSFCFFGACISHCQGPTSAPVIATPAPLTCSANSDCGQGFCSNGLCLSCSQCLSAYCAGHCQQYETTLAPVMPTTTTEGIACTYLECQDMSQYCTTRGVCLPCEVCIRNGDLSPEFDREDCPPWCQALDLPRFCGGDVACPSDSLTWCDSRIGSCSACVSNEQWPLLVGTDDIGDPQQPFPDACAGVCLTERDCDAGNFCRPAGSSDAPDAGMCTSCASCDQALSSDCTLVCNPPCEAHDDCGDDEYCNALGECQPCTDSVKVTKDATPVPAKCLACMAHEACGALEFCNWRGECANCSGCYSAYFAYNNAPCPVKCHECAAHSDCPDRQFCSSDNRCEFCSLSCPADGGNDEEEDCKDRCALCFSSRDCSRGTFCNAQTQQCTACTACSDDDTPPYGGDQSCSQACPGFCSSHAQCAGAVESSFCTTTNRCVHCILCDFDPYFPLDNGTCSTLCPTCFAHRDCEDTLQDGTTFCSNLFVCEPCSSCALIDRIDGVACAESCSHCNVNSDCGSPGEAFCGDDKRCAKCGADCSAGALDVHGASCGDHCLRCDAHGDCDEGHYCGETGSCHRCDLCGPATPAVTGTCVQACTTDTTAAATTIRTTTTSTSVRRVTTRLVFDLDPAGLSDAVLGEEVRQLLLQAGIQASAIFSVRIVRGSVVAILVTTEAAATVITQSAASGSLQLRGAPAAVQSDNAEQEGDSSTSAVAIYAGAGAGAFVLMLLILLAVRRRRQNAGRVVAMPSAENSLVAEGLIINPMYASAAQVGSKGQIYLPEENEV
jgi:hypothetical protein